MSGKGEGERPMSRRSLRVSKPVLASVAALVTIALLGGIWIVDRSSDKASAGWSIANCRGIVRRFSEC